MIKTFQAPDIIVTSQDGEYLMLVEVKLKGSIAKNVIEQLKHTMASIGCSVGLVVAGERVILLRDSLEKYNGESIDVVGEAKLPDSLLPPADEQWKGQPAVEFESRVQRWLEKLKLTASMDNFPNDLRNLLGEPIISLLRIGEVRAAASQINLVRYNAMIKTSQPDIVVTSQDGEYLMIVEVKLKDISINARLIAQLKNDMASIGCSVGLVVAGERVILLRDSLEKYNGESIDVVGEAKLPNSLLPSADEQWKGQPAVEFESRVQRWLEKLKLTANMENFPNDLKNLLGEPIISLLRIGEVRAAGPRWSKSAK